MSSYVNKRTRVFNAAMRLPRQRSESRLKSYQSATDNRAWSDCTEQRRQYILELIKNGSKGCSGLGRYIPIEVIIDQLLANKNAQIAELLRQIEEMKKLLKSMNVSWSDHMSQRNERLSSEVNPDDPLPKEFERISIGASPSGKRSMAERLSQQYAADQHEPSTHSDQPEGFSVDDPLKQQFDQISTGGPSVAGSSTVIQQEEFLQDDEADVSAAARRTLDMNEVEISKRQSQRMSRSGSPSAGSRRLTDGIDHQYSKGKVSILGATDSSGQKLSPEELSRQQSQRTSKAGTQEESLKQIQRLSNAGENQALDATDSFGQSLNIDESLKQQFERLSIGGSEGLEPTGSSGIKLSPGDSLKQQFQRLSQSGIQNLSASGISGRESLRQQSQRTSKGGVQTPGATDSFGQGLGPEESLRQQAQRTSKGGVQVPGATDGSGQRLSPGDSLRQQFQQLSQSGQTLTPADSASQRLSPGDSLRQHFQQSSKNEIQSIGPTDSSGQKLSPGDSLRQQFQRYSQGGSQNLGPTDSSGQRLSPGDSLRQQAQRMSQGGTQNLGPTDSSGQRLSPGDSLRLQAQRMSQGGTQNLGPADSSGQRLSPGGSLRQQAQRMSQGGTQNLGPMDSSGQRLSPGDSLRLQSQRASQGGSQNLGPTDSSGQRLSPGDSLRQQAQRMSQGGTQNLGPADSSGQRLSPGDSLRQQTQRMSQGGTQNLGSKEGSGPGSTRQSLKGQIEPTASVRISTEYEEAPLKDQARRSSLGDLPPVGILKDTTSPSGSAKRGSGRMSRGETGTSDSGYPASDDEAQLYADKQRRETDASRASQTKCVGLEEASKLEDSRALDKDTTGSKLVCKNPTCPSSKPSTAPADATRDGTNKFGESVLQSAMTDSSLKYVYNRLVEELDFMEKGQVEAEVGAMAHELRQSSCNCKKTLQLAQQAIEKLEKIRGLVDNKVACSGDSATKSCRCKDQNELENRVSKLEDTIRERDALRQRVARLEAELERYRDLPCRVDRFNENARAVLADAETCERLERRFESVGAVEDDVAGLLSRTRRADEKKPPAATVETQSRRQDCSVCEQYKSRVACLEHSLDRAKCKQREMDLLKAEHEHLHMRIKQLNLLEENQGKLVSKLKLLEKVQEERNEYKEKYEKLVHLQCECERLRDQLKNVQILEREKDMLHRQVRDLECCIADLEDEVKRLVGHIDRLTQGRDDQQDRIKDVFCDMRAEIERKNMIIARSDENLAMVQGKLEESIIGVSSETSLLKNQIEDYENQISVKDCEIAFLKKSLREKDNLIHSLSRSKQLSQQILETKERDFKELMTNNEFLQKEVERLNIFSQEPIKQAIVDSRALMGRAKSEIKKHYTEREENLSNLHYVRELEDKIILLEGELKSIKGVYSEMKDNSNENVVPQLLQKAKIQIDNTMKDNEEKEDEKKCCDCDYYKRQMDKICSENDALKQEYSKLMKNYKESTNEISSLRSDRNKIEKEIDNLKTKLSNFEVVMAEERNLHEKERQEYVKNIEEQKQLLINAAQECKEFKSKENEKGDEIKSLKEQLESLKAEKNATVDEQNKSLEKVISTSRIFELENKDLTNQLKNHKEENITLKDQNDDLTKHLKTKTEENLLLKYQHDELGHQFELIQKENDDLIKENRRLKNINDRFESNLKTCKSDMKNLNIDLSRCRDMSSHLHKENKKLLFKVEELKKSNEINLVDYRKINEELLEENTLLRIKVGDLEMELLETRFRLGSNLTESEKTSDLSKVKKDELESELLEARDRPESRSKESTISNDVFEDAEDLANESKENQSKKKKRRVKCTERKRREKRICGSSRANRLCFEPRKSQLDNSSTLTLPSTSIDTDKVLTNTEERESTQVLSKERLSTSQTGQNSAAKMLTNTDERDDFVSSAILDEASSELKVEMTSSDDRDEELRNVMKEIDAQLGEAIPNRAASQDVGTMTDRTAIDDQKRECNELIKDLKDRHEREIAVLTKRINESEHEIELLMKQKKESEHEIELLMKQKNESEIESLEKQKNEGQVESLAKQKNENEREIESLTRRKDESEREVESLKRWKNENEREIESLIKQKNESEIESMTKRKNESEHETESLTKQKNESESESLTRRKDESEREIESLTKQKNVSEIESMTKRKNESEREIESLTRRKDGSEREIDPLKRLKSESDRKIELLTRQNNDSELEIKSLKKWKSESERKIESLTRRKDEVERENESLREINEARNDEDQGTEQRLREQYESLRHANDELRKQKAECGETVRKLKEQYERELSNLKRQNEASVERLQRAHERELERIVQENCTIIDGLKEELKIYELSIRSSEREINALKQKEMKISVKDTEDEKPVKDTDRKEVTKKTKSLNVSTFENVCICPKLPHVIPIIPPIAGELNAPNDHFDQVGHIMRKSLESGIQSLSFEELKSLHSIVRSVAEKKNAKPLKSKVKCSPSRRKSPASVKEAEPNKIPSIHSAIRKEEERIARISNILQKEKEQNFQLKAKLNELENKSKLKKRTVNVQPKCIHDSTNLHAKTEIFGPLCNRQLFRSCRTGSPQSASSSLDDLDVGKRLKCYPERAPPKILIPKSSIAACEKIKKRSFSSSPLRIHVRNSADLVNRQAQAKMGGAMYPQPDVQLKKPAKHKCACGKVYDKDVK